MRIRDSGRLMMAHVERPQLWVRSNARGPTGAPRPIGRFVILLRSGAATRDRDPTCDDTPQGRSGRNALRPHDVNAARDCRY